MLEFEKSPWTHLVSKNCKRYFLKREFHESFSKNIRKILKIHLVGLNGPTRIHVWILEVLDSLDLKNHNFVIRSDPGVNKALF